jgi:hypothetical protein
MLTLQMQSDDDPRVARLLGAGGHHPRRRESTLAVRVYVRVAAVKKQQRRDALMATIDQLNRRYGAGTVRWAVCGMRPSWAMRRQRLSGAATTCLEAIPNVDAAG